MSWVIDSRYTYILPFTQPSILRLFEVQRTWRKATEAEVSTKLTYLASSAVCSCWSELSLIFWDNHEVKRWTFFLACTGNGRRSVNRSLNRLRTVITRSNGFALPMQKAHSTQYHTPHSLAWTDQISSSCVRAGSTVQPPLLLFVVVLLHNLDRGQHVGGASHSYEWADLQG